MKCNKLDYTTTENDLRSYEATTEVAMKAQKNFWGSNGIQTHELMTDTGAMLYQLSCMYEALLGVGQEWVQFITVIWREWQDVYMV